MPSRVDLREKVVLFVSSVLFGVSDLAFVQRPAAQICSRFGIEKRGENAESVHFADDS